MLRTLAPDAGQLDIQGLFWMTTRSSTNPRLRANNIAAVVGLWQPRSSQARFRPLKELLVLGHRAIPYHARCAGPPNRPSAEPTACSGDELKSRNREREHTRSRSHVDGNSSSSDARGLPPISNTADDAQVLGCRVLDAPTCLPCRAGIWRFRPV